MSRRIRVSTLKIALFAVPAAVILAGIGAWAASTTQARVIAPIGAGPAIDFNANNDECEGATN